MSYTFLEAAAARAGRNHADTQPNGTIMAQQTAPKPRKQPAESEQQQPKAPKKAWGLARLLTRKWITIIVAASIVIHAVGFTYYRIVAAGSKDNHGPEVTLGVFSFEADDNEHGRVLGARFSLALALLEQVDRAARHRMKTHRYRVRQDVEELLRQAHSGDFEDPTLGELKRRLQERINETLAIRAISDVIITDLKLDLNDQPPEPLADTAGAVPWVDKPSG